jgi:hypothetical protein
MDMSSRILKSRLQWEHDFIRIEDRRIPKEILTYNPVGRNTVTTIMMEESTYSTRGSFYIGQT